MRLVVTEARNENASTKIGRAVPDGTGDDRDRRALTDSLEVRWAWPCRQLDAVEGVEEVEMPPVAAELSVGDGTDADLLETGDHRGDLLVLDRPQLFGGELPVLPGLASRGEA